jgi:hypothetical protein
MRKNELNCIKLKGFCFKRNRLKRQPKQWEKIFASYLSDKELIPRIYRELKKLNPQTINIQKNKWAYEVNREFLKEEVQMASKYIKMYSTSLAIKEMQVKTTLSWVPACSCL